VKAVPNPPPILSGNVVTLRPLTSGDVDTLVKLADEDTFRYFVNPAPKVITTESMGRYLNYILSNSSIRGWLVLDTKTGQPLGSSCFLDVREVDDHVEIGMTFYVETARGTAINPATKLLMLTYAFDELGCERVSLKGDALNERSRAAILKLGAKYEGTLRSFRRTEHGRMRDTAYYGILKDEWPAIRAKLIERVSAF
jgi:RimJ/RimL family protein N-acetyltransferase